MKKASTVLYLDPIRTAKGWKLLTGLVVDEGKRQRLRGEEDRMPEPLRKLFNLPPSLKPQGYKRYLWKQVLSDNAVVAALGISALLYLFDGSKVTVPEGGKLPPVRLGKMDVGYSSEDRQDIPEVLENRRKAAWMLWNKAQTDNRYIPWTKALTLMCKPPRKGVQK